MIKKTFKNKGVIFAKKISLDNIEGGLNFYSDSEEYIQVGTWNYSKGQYLTAHNHNIIDRRINRTCEVIIVLQGRVHVDLYDEEDSKIDETKLNSNEMMVLLNGGHGYTILENNTKVIEIKNGPYIGAEEDRRRLV